MNDSVYVIYKDGVRLTKEKAGMNVKVAYLKKGSAKSVVTALVHDYLTWKLRISEVYQSEKWKEEKTKEKQRYEIIEFVPKG